MQQELRTFSLDSPPFYESFEGVVQYLSRLPAGTSDYPNTGTQIWDFLTGNQRKNSQNGNGTILSLSI